MDWIFGRVGGRGDIKVPVFPHICGHLDSLGTCPCTFPPGHSYVFITSTLFHEEGGREFRLNFQGTFCTSHLSSEYVTG